MFFFLVGKRFYKNYSFNFIISMSKNVIIFNKYSGRLLSSGGTSSGGIV